MLKSIWVTAAIALCATAWLLLPMRHEAAAQTAPLYVNAVDLDIAPGNVDKFVAALKTNGAASVQEPGCREFDVAVSQKDPNHVFVFEVYDNAAAYASHQKTAHYNKFIAVSMMMIRNYTIRPFSSVTMNTDGTAPSGSLFVDSVELDIAPAEFDKFMDALKENADATMKEPGTREFDVAVSQKDRHHVFLFELYDNAAALEAVRATDRFKAFQAATAGMVAKRDVKNLSLAAAYAKGT